MDISLMNASLLTVTEHAPPVVASVLLAMLATYVALDFADRLRGATERGARASWVLAGSVAMGTGIWAMHFVGMSAARFPFVAAIDADRTAESWLVAVFASVAFLVGASRQRPGIPALAVVSTLIGCGVAWMHFTGMGALMVAPAPVYRFELVAQALGLAVAGTFVALMMAGRMPGVTGWRRALRQLGAALVFGAALSGMHYRAMAATEFALGTVCRTVHGLHVDALSGTVGLSSATLLVLMLLMTSLQERAELRVAQLDGSLGIVREELRLVSMTDAVTGLPNRLVFQDRLKQAAARSDRDGSSVVVMFVNVDGFKLLEHPWNEASDEGVLRRIAARLVDAVRNSDTVAGVGGDQFLVMMDGLQDLEPAVRVADALCRASPSELAGAGDPAPGPTLSIGIAVYPADGALAPLVGHAATAAEAATHSGGNCYRFFEPTMNADALEKAQWADHLRLAIGRGEMSLHYQPKFHARGGAMAGVEALLRWNHPERGAVSPGVFIPMAEKFGLIPQIGHWVIEEACRQMAAWAAVGIELRVAVNVSVYQLRTPGLASAIVEALERHAVDPSLLTCEITESGAMDDTEGSLAVFTQLKAAGVQISIDDFGTGYSSLSYLRKLPVHQLKVDRSFVNDLCDCADARLIVAAIVDLAHALRLEVVAEGVETACQQAILMELGCDKFQGFLLARPMPAAKLTAQILAAREPEAAPSAALHRHAVAQMHGA